jgi:hypothetical protein
MPPGPDGMPFPPPDGGPSLPAGFLGQDKGPVPATMPSSEPPAAKLRPAVLWVTVQGHYVKPVPVLAGLSDGTNTQVVGKEISEGMEVVTGASGGAGGGPDGQSPGGGSPFMPRPPKNFKPPAGGPPM